MIITFLSIFSHATVSFTLYCKPKNHVSRSASVLHTSSNRSFPFHFAYGAKEETEQRKSYDNVLLKNRTKNIFLEDRKETVWMEDRTESIYRRTGRRSFYEEEHFSEDGSNITFLSHLFFIFKILFIFLFFSMLP